MSFNQKNLKSDLLFLPLGGCGEIGLNLNLYHFNEKWIMVDCGTGFVDDNSMPGVDIVVPDIAFILENKIKIEALFLTHAHEDHLGAVCYLWQELRCPIYSTKFTADFLLAKLASFHISKEIVIHEMKPNKTINVGPFTIQPIGLAHSTPEMKALLITTSKGNIFHTGDWKIDHTPVIKDHASEEELRKIGDIGIDAMVCDSTNIFSEGWSASEGLLEESLTDIVQKCKQLVMVTTFASNISRLKTLIKVAEKCKRQVIISGTSLDRIVGVAIKSHYIDNTDFLSARDIESIDRNKAFIIATGCQGEPLASMAKAAQNIHPYIKLRTGDTVIFSSKIIPGNEKKISSVINALIENDINVITEKNDLVHVSGHPNREELKYMYDLIRPYTAIPVHGEIMHLKEHCDFARKHCAIPQAIRMKNGDILKIDGKSITKIGTVKSDYLGVDGSILHHHHSNIMKARRKLQSGGIVICNILFYGKSILLDVTAPGAIDENTEKDILIDLHDSLYRFLSLDKHKALVRHSEFGKLTTALQNKITNFTYKEVGLNPMIKIFMHRT